MAKLETTGPGLAGVFNPSAPAVSSTMWRGPRAQFESSGPNGTVTVETFTCQHACGKVVFCCDPITKKPLRAEDCGGICNICHKNICPDCVTRDVCVPLNDALAVIEGQHRVPPELKRVIDWEFRRKR